MPVELRPQMELVKKVLASMNIKTLEMGGYEADDLLGTLANIADNKGISPSNSKWRQRFVATCNKHY